MRQNIKVWTMIAFQTIIQRLKACIPIFKNYIKINNNKDMLNFFLFFNTSIWPTFFGYQCSKVQHLDFPCLYFLDINLTMVDTETSNNLLPHKKVS